MADDCRQAAIFDLDGTVTRRDTYIAFLAAFLRAHPGRLPATVMLPFATVMHLAGMRDNTWLKRFFLRTVMRGAAREEVDRCAGVFLDRLLKSGINPGALAAIARHKKDQHYLVLVTASFDFYARELGRRLGFDEVICPHAVRDANDRLTGELVDGNCYGSRKVQYLESWFAAHPGPWHTTAYSDHHSDLPMLEWADQGVAVNPDRDLRRVARGLGFPVEDWRIAP